MDLKINIIFFLSEVMECVRKLISHAFTNSAFIASNSNFRPNLFPSNSCLSCLSVNFFLNENIYWLRALGERFFPRSAIHSSSVYENPQIHIEPLSVFSFSVTTDDLQSNLCEIRYRNVFHSRRAAATIVIWWKRKMFLCTSEFSSCLKNAGVGKWGQIVCFLVFVFILSFFLLSTKEAAIFPHWKETKEILQILSKIIIVRFCKSCIGSTCRLRKTTVIWNLKCSTEAKLEKESSNGIISIWFDKREKEGELASVHFYFSRDGCWLRVSSFTARLLFHLTRDEEEAWKTFLVKRTQLREKVWQEKNLSWKSFIAFKPFSGFNKTCVNRLSFPVVISQLPALVYLLRFTRFSGYV